MGRPVSRERVRQIETEGLERMRAALRGKAPADVAAE